MMRMFLSTFVFLTISNVALADGLLVTFDVGGESFQAEVQRQDAIQYVLDFAAGHAARKIPVGRLREGAGGNAPWSWHLDPNSLRFEEPRAQAGCDALPSRVARSRTEHSSLDARIYCPQHARILAVQDCRAGSDSCSKVRGLFAGRSPY